jgi:hypothetical protein
MLKRSSAGLGVALIAFAFALAGPSAASSDEVDESRLVPALNESFAPWTCKMKVTGPVCSGERHLSSDWAPVEEFPCDVPLYGRGTDNRYSTRFYDHDYLNYDRKVRADLVDMFSTSPGGPAAVTIETRVRFREPFDVPGDDSTRDIITEGVLWDIQAANGRPIVLVVGTLVEPHDGPATFTGHATHNGVTATYDDAPLEEVLPEDVFLSAICETAKGAG